MEFEAKVVTVSDSVHAGTAEDATGPEIGRFLAGAGFRVVAHTVVPDGVASVAGALRAAVAGFEGLVVTAGGTGFAPRDLTPEATSTVLERQAPGLAEAMRRAGPKGALSRAVAGTVGGCIVLNLPGSPAGSVECLRAVVDVLPHALALLAGEDPHPHGGASPTGDRR